MRWTKNCLKCWTQGGILKSSWRLVINSAPKRSIRGPTQFNIFINDLDGGIGCTHSKAEGDAERGRVDGTLDGCAVFQRVLGNLAKWVDKNLKKFK